jgi:hypothetical protein
MEPKYYRYETCEFCGNKFLLTHGNRKFCPPVKNYDGNHHNHNCKTAFNNLKGQEKRDKTKMVTARQYQNWFGLNQLFINNKIIASEADLRSAGVYLESFIITKTSKTTGEEVKCYIEYGLIKLNENEFKIIKHGLQF